MLLDVRPKPYRALVHREPTWPSPSRLNPRTPGLAQRRGHLDEFFDATFCRARRNAPRPPRTRRAGAGTGGAGESFSCRMLHRTSAPQTSASTPAFARTCVMARCRGAFEGHRGLRPHVARARCGRDVLANEDDEAFAQPVDIRFARSEHFQGGSVIEQREQQLFERGVLMPLSTRLGFRQMQAGVQFGRDHGASVVRPLLRRCADAL